MLNLKGKILLKFRLQISEPGRCWGVGDKQTFLKRTATHIQGPVSKPKTHKRLPVWALKIPHHKIIVNL